MDKARLFACVLTIDSSPGRCFTLAVALSNMKPSKFDFTCLTWASQLHSDVEIPSQVSLVTGVVYTVGCY